MKRIHLVKFLAGVSAVIFVLVLWRPPMPAGAGTTEPASMPTTATAPTTAPTTAPAIPQVHWHSQHKPAAEQAKKDNTLLLVIYMEDASPACQAFERLSLKRVSVRRFLASFSAVKLDITTAEGRKRFAKTGAKETPLTRVFTPKGELLDSIPGCIIPASAFLGRLEYSLNYWSAAAKPGDAEARWKAVQARLELSTRAEAVSAIDKLLKMSVRKLPTGATPGRLNLAKGKALMFTKPARADKALKKAMKLGSGDPLAEGEAMLELAHLAEEKEHYKRAYDYCRRYIKSFPAGPAVGRAYYTKAVLEFQALDDEAGARKTIEKFIREYPNDPKVVPAKQLLKMIDPARPVPTTMPASAPASRNAKK